MYRYVDVLQDMVHSYNNTFHRTIGQAPSLFKKEDVPKLREKIYGIDNDVNARVKLKVGDKVRISKLDGRSIKVICRTGPKRYFL